MPKAKCPRIVREGGLLRNLMTRMEGGYLNLNHAEACNASRYRVRYELFLMAEIEASHAAEWLRLSEVHPGNTSWKAEYQAAKAQSLEYYRQFLDTWERF